MILSSFQRFRKPLIQLHFVGLGLAIINAGVTAIWSFSLATPIELGLELFVAISGLVLCFAHLRPIRPPFYYFMFYGIAAALSLISLIFKGVFVFFLFMILFPLLPNEVEFQQDGIVIETPVQGVMARCCEYVVKEEQMGIFVQELGTFETEGQLNMESVKVRRVDGKVQLNYRLEGEVEDREQLFSLN